MLNKTTFKLKVGTIKIIIIVHMPTKFYQINQKIKKDPGKSFRSGMNFKNRPMYSRCPHLCLPSISHVHCNPNALTLNLQTLHFLTSSLRVEGLVCLEISSTHCWAIGAGEIIRVAGDGMAGCNQITKICASLHKFKVYTRIFHRSILSN